MSDEIERRVARLEAHLAQASPDSPSAAVYVEVLEGLTGLSRAEILAHAPDDAALFRAVLNWMGGHDPWDNLPSKEAPNDR